MDSIKVTDGVLTMRVPIKDGCITLETIKRYWVNAAGLTYKLNGEDNALICNDGVIVLNQKVENYNVFYAKRSPLTGLQLKRNQKVMQILDNKETSSIDLALLENQEPGQKKSKPNCKHNKILKVGWMHRKDENEDFKQVTYPTGGVKDLLLVKKENYSYNQILDKCIAVMKDDLNASYFDKSSVVVLGNSNKKIFYQFEDSGGQKCDFWTFCGENLSTSSRSNIYVMTTERTSNNHEKSNKNFRYNPDDVISNKELHQDLLDDLRLEIYNAEGKLNQNDRSSNIFQSKKSGNCKSTLNQSVFKPKYDHHQFKTPNGPYLKKQKNYICSNNNSNGHINSGNNYHGFDDITSKKKTLPVSKNQKGSNMRYLEQTPDSNKTLSFGIGSSLKLKINNKKIESLKVVSSCSVNEYLESGSQISNFRKLPSVCSKTTEYSSLHLNFTIPVIKITDLEFVKKNQELSEDPNADLGAGSFGEVRKARWLGDFVAVKTVEVNTPQDRRLIIREIAIMEKVRHKNIVQIQAVCFDEDRCHLIMELVDGADLRTVLFIEKDKYSLNDTLKLNIALQICRAISYLHNHPTGSIVHRDIKPENILLSKTNTIKICDFGLGKLKDMPKPLESTIGNNLKGTFMYMSPEILLHSQPASKSSDVWAAACVIVELFKQSRVWSIPISLSGIQKLTYLRQLMKKNKVPDLKQAPEQIQNALLVCFDWNPTSRCDINELLNNLEAIENSKDRFMNVF